MKEIAEREGVATGITMQAEELQRKNRDAFRIPEWFLYTSRAFLTLEGVSLQADENYSLIKSCFPYVAKRLVGDTDPRAEKALRDLLYGAGGALDATRLTDLADGFSSYTTTSKIINEQVNRGRAEAEIGKPRIEADQRTTLERKNRLIETESAITLAKDSADILLAPEGNLLQNLLIEETARAASASVKDTVRSTFVDGPRLFRESLPFRIGTILPSLPFEGLVAPFVQKTTEEVQAQELAEKLLALVPPTEPNDSISDGAMLFQQSLQELDAEQAALVVREIRMNLPKYAPLVGQLSGKFASLLFRTARTNLDATIAEQSQSGRFADPIAQAAARGLSEVARRGEEAFASGAKSTDLGR
jgi:hypothetical protein